jgi:Uncharacterized protein conserved in bacteria (DUF2325)
MSLFSHAHLSSVFSTAARRSEEASVLDSVRMKTHEQVMAELEGSVAPGASRRTAIWDMHASVHCSIIGTCLSTGELRRLLVKLAVQGAESADDHDLHMLGVLLAGRPQAGAKVLQKTLDRCHAAAIKQFAKARDDAGLAALWDDALKRGDIPGAYWALLSHPAATSTLTRRVFGDVHMLSHLVGAANRADIRRLRQLEAENAALNARLERQQRQLRDGFVERDGTIRRLNEALARSLADAPASLDGAAQDDAQAARDAITELDRRLAREQALRERLERRVEALAATLRDSEKARQQLERERDNLAQDLATIETRIRSLVAESDEQAFTDVPLGGLTLLYVGGRPQQVPQFRGLVERCGGGFLHHDGGVEHSPTLLPGLVSHADWVLFPVDCVSHDAVGIVKRSCRQSGKRYMPLKTASMTCLLLGLSTLHGAAAGVLSPTFVPPCRTP